MLTTLKHLFSPPVFEDDNKTRAARVLTFITLPFITVYIVYIIVELAFIGKLSEINYLLVFTLILVYSLMRQGWVRPASALLVIASWGLLTYQGWRAGGVRDASVVAYLIVVLVAHLLLGWRAGLGIAVLCILATFGFAYAEEAHLWPPDIDPAYEMAVDLSLLIIMATVLVSITTTGLNRALQLAHQNEQRLAESNQDLRALQSSLEQRVVERTRGLETVANLGEFLGAILHIDQLLVEIVNRVKETFAYYHVQIYFLDDDRQALTVVEGTGEAGQEMKAAGHTISLQAASLVARAARSGQVVWVNDVRQAKDWLPNPRLPETRSEMAVPITVDGRVVGVLDVQSNEVNSLDEGAAYLLRSLAQQIAIALRNARLFGEVEQALAEARQAQERYVERSWNKNKLAAQSQDYLYVRPGASSLTPETLVEATRQAFARKHAAILASDGHTLVAPVLLRDTAIGALQLHRAGLPAPESSGGIPTGSSGIPTGSGGIPTGSGGIPMPPEPWTEEDASLVEAVLDQVAQAAETLRLLDVTQERASREQLISRISDRMRRAPDLDTLMKIAVGELSRVLGPDRTFVRLGSPAGLAPEGDLTSAQASFRTKTAPKPPLEQRQHAASPWDEEIS